MKCIICKLVETNAGKVTVTLNRGQSIIIKNGPTQIRNNCGECYLSDEISEQVMMLAENAVSHNAEVDTLCFVA